MARIDIDWLRLARVTTQYVVPGLLALAFLVEVAGTLTVAAYDYLIAVVFSVFTVVMIAACGWIVFLWDIDRLFFSLERKIDAQAVSEAAADGSLLGRVRDMLSSKVQHLRAEAVRSIEKAYWEDINAGGVLAFPHPDIARAIEHIDAGRRDLLAPLTELVARTVPVGNSPRRWSRGALQVSRAGGQATALSPAHPTFPLPAQRALRPRRFVLLFQHSRMVARERIGVHSASGLRDKHLSLPARSHASRRVLRFHGAYAPLNVTDLHQSTSDGIRVLHPGIPHVRSRLLHLIPLQSSAVRRAALEGSAAVG